MAKVLGLALLVALTAASFTGYLEPGLDAALGKRLAAHNDEYLERSFNEAIAGFGVMSMWKAGLDIIEGSEIGASIGVSAQLEVGDIVQPAYDYVDIAWRTLFIGSVTLLGIRYLLEASELIDSGVVTFTFIMLTLAFLAAWVVPSRRRIRDLLRDVVGASIVASLALFYLLPLSVWGASRLSGVLTAPSIQEANAGFAGAREQLFPDPPENGDNWAKRLKAIPDRIEQIGTYLKDNATQMITWTVKLVAGYIFDCIVFPVALFALLLWLTRSVLGYISRRNMHRTFREDLRAALAGRERPASPERDPLP
jgi:hypothetical protein